MRRLDGEYVRLAGSLARTPETTNVMEVNGDARRAVGQWPTAEGLADAILGALTDAAQDESDEERRTKLSAAATGVRRLGRGLFTDVVAGVNTKSAGL